MDMKGLPSWSLRILACFSLLNAIAFSLQTQARADVTLADFNGTGFSFTFDGFTQTLSANSVRLRDPNNGWGGGSLTFNPIHNLASLANQRFSVDVIRQAGHQASTFKLELFDNAGNSGKWNFDSSPLVTGQPTNLLANATLGQPNSGVGILNLSQIQRMQVIGDFTSPLPFDLSFDKIAITDQPAPCDPYCGWQPDAPWRAQAEAQIDAIRKADLTVTVVDAAGIPVPNATVDITMQRHEFEFSTAVQGPRINSSSNANITYQQNLEQWFNAATFENNHKWPFWVGDQGTSYSQTNTAAATQWLEARDFTLRGHNQVWPGRSHLPVFMQNRIDEYRAPGTTSGRKLQLANEMRQAVLDHIQEIGTATAGHVKYWDVLNEPRDNHDLMDILGQNVIVDWFNAARAVDPNVKLFVNEYGILPSYNGTNNTSQQQSLLATLNLLKSAGAPLDGVGLQAHFSDDDLTGIDRLWEIVDQFGDVVDHVHITEFDIDTTDEALQGAYSRDFLTAMFAHEDIDAFSVWGFWECAVFDPQRAMFRNDWSAKPNGQAWLDLIFDEWWTDETVATAADGKTTVRAFRGDHEVSATYKGSSVDEAVHVGAGGATLQLQLPILVADYEGDGDVDGLDFLVWQRQFGQSGDLSADGDGNGVVDADDLALWKVSYQAMLTANSISVPEPYSVFGCSFVTLARSCKRPALAREPGPCDVNGTTEVVVDRRLQLWEPAD
jgi:GH35 family endo-1,4-beta-xylanase